MKKVMVLFFCTLILSAVVSAQNDVAISGTVKLPTYALKSQVDSLSAKIATLQAQIITLLAQLGAKLDTVKAVPLNGITAGHFPVFDGTQFINGPFFIGSSKDSIHIMTIPVWTK